MPYLTREFGNPLSIYELGQRAQEARESARQKVADLLGARPREIVFTGSGTESCNLALRGVAFASRSRGNHIITSAIEHDAVRKTGEQLAKRHDFEVTYVPVDQYGLVDPAEVERAITDQTILISIMYANHEVGTIEPVAEIGALARERGIRFHSDACQAANFLNLDVNELKVDLLSLSGHKFYGPKGSGVLYVRRGTRLEPQMTGGGHEHRMRSGTEAIHQIVGLATALEIARAGREENGRRLAALRDKLIEHLTEKIPYTHLTGHPTQRLPNVASFCFEFIEGEGILLRLDLLGVAGSSGSACTSATLEPSHILRAMGIPVEIAHGSLRLSLGPEHTEEDVDYVIEVLPGIVEVLRSMSPIYEGKQ